MNERLSFKLQQAAVGAVLAHHGVPAYTIRSRQLSLRCVRAVDQARSRRKATKAVAQVIEYSVSVYCAGAGVGTVAEEIVTLLAGVESPQA